MSARAEPLADRPGDPQRGMALAVDAEKGNCIACHVLPIPAIPAGSFGDLGPSLEGVGSRLTVEELRQRIVDPKIMSPDTIMPAYHATEGLHRVQPRYAGKPVLDAREVEDVVAYLETLK
ncbi:MAG: sulfur oxidation c-type cytochrome SoxX [Sphingobium sp.]